MKNVKKQSAESAHGFGGKSLIICGQKDGKRVRILFMGTPDIAAVALERLVNEGLEVVGVVTQPDKPRGRKQILTPPEAKQTAEKFGIPVFQPEKLKNGELAPVLEELKPELIAVVAYGKILPEYVLNYPKYGCVNMHGSLLPKYRGAAPIQWAVINGDEETGVTTQKMAKGLDTGDMLLSKRIKIGKYETSEQLFERIAELGAQVLVETINNIENITPVPQNEEEATYAPMLAKEMARIDWSKSAECVSKLICGMNSWPIAYTECEKGIMKVYSALISENEDENAVCGSIIDFDANGLKVKCGSGAIIIKEIQFPGGKRMAVGDYLKGHSFEKGYRFF